MKYFLKPTMYGQFYAKLTSIRYTLQTSTPDSFQRGYILRVRAISNSRPVQYVAFSKAQSALSKTTSHSLPRNHYSPSPPVLSLLDIPPYHPAK